ncbi:hypothetical protein FU659_20015 [Paenibacillus sp. N3.4]|nr:hypothetical protein FU659_20015 [Paenibacillus sp. N3.4]
MSKKLEVNGLWDSNRMMLPQHRETAISCLKKSNTFSDKYSISMKFISFLLHLANPIYKRTVQLTIYDKTSSELFRV